MNNYSILVWNDGFMFFWVLKLIYCQSVGSLEKTRVVVLSLRLLSSLVIVLFVVAFDIVIVVRFWCQVLLNENIWWGILQMLEGSKHPVPLTEAYVPWSLAHPSRRKPAWSPYFFCYPNLKNRDTEIPFGLSLSSSWEHTHFHAGPTYM